MPRELKKGYYLGRYPVKASTHKRVMKTFGRSLDEHIDAILVRGLDAWDKANPELPIPKKGKRPSKLKAAVKGAKDRLKAKKGAPAKGRTLADETFATKIRLAAKGKTIAQVVKETKAEAAKKAAKAKPRKGKQLRVDEEAAAK
jgi:hypothetical protein